MMAQPSQHQLMHTHPTLLEEEIRARERARDHLYAEAADLSERASHLDVHREQGVPERPRHVLVVSRRLPALQLLLAAVRNDVAKVEYDEADAADDMDTEIRTIALSQDLSSVVLVHRHGELSSLVSRLVSVSEELGVHFDQDTWSRHRALFSDRAGDYFHEDKLTVWHQAAERHEFKEEQKIVKAEGRVNVAKEDARRAESKLQKEEDQRQRDLSNRRDQRKRRQEEHGATRPWAEQHDPAAADFSDDETPDHAGPLLFGQPLLSCSREMSTREGLGRLPRAIEMCAEYVRRQLGTTNADALADLFKMPRNLDMVEKLRNKLDRVDMTNLEQFDILDVAWIVVTWLKELPQPLLSSSLPGGDDEELFQSFQQVGLPTHHGGLEGGVARAMSDLKQILDDLPADHYTILAFIMELLHEVELENARRNDTPIDAKRISLVLTPAVLRESTGSERETTRLNYRVVSLMIEKFDLVFFEQKLYPGSYSIEGHVSSIYAHGTLVLTDSHRVEGYVVVSPCIEQLEETSLHPASKMVRHIMDGGTWGMDGKVNFSAR
jgi:hypothetical protein